MATTVSITEVQRDIETFKGDKAKLMQHYADEQRKILNQYGGNFSDLPMDDENPYHKIQAKMALLNQICASQIERKEPHEIEAMRKKK